MVVKKVKLVTVSASAMTLLAETSAFIVVLWCFKDVSNTDYSVEPFICCTFKPRRYNSKTRETNEPEGSHVKHFC